MPTTKPMELPESPLGTGANQNKKKQIKVRTQPVKSNQPIQIVSIYNPSRLCLFLTLSLFLFIHLLLRIYGRFRPCLMI